MRFRSFVGFLFIFACEGPIGPEGPQGPAGEMATLITTVEDKNYTECNPYWVTVFFDDPVPNEETAVIWVGFENDNGLYQNVEALGRVYFDGILYASGDCGYDSLEGYAVLIYDFTKQLLNKKIKIQYIP